MMRLFLFLLLLAGISAQVNNKPGSSYCRKRRLCLNNQFWNRNSRANVQEASCYCDKNCILFNDCCIDSANVKLQTFNEDFICTSDGLAEAFYLNQKCPSRSSKILRNLCETTSPDDPFSLVPVSSHKTFFTYRNIFCAICNEEPIPALRLWNTVVSCTLSDHQTKIVNAYRLRNKLRFNLETKEWDFGPLKLFMDSRFNNVSCQTLYHIPQWPDAEHTQKCEEYVYWCSENWNQPNIEKKCIEGYTSIVYRRNDSYAYKNIYCAICNHVTQGELQCDITEEIIDWDRSTGEKLISYYMNGEDSECQKRKLYATFCPPGETIINNQCQPSQQADPCTIEVVLPLISSHHFVPETCYGGFIYDPYTGMCRSFTGRRTIPPERINFMPVHSTNDENVRTSDHWHFHRLNVHSNMGTPQEESFSQSDFKAEHT